MFPAPFRMYITVEFSWSINDEVVNNESTRRMQILFSDIMRNCEFKSKNDISSVGCEDNHFGDTQRETVRFLIHWCHQDFLGCPNNFLNLLLNNIDVLIIHPNNLECEISKESNILIIHPNNLECKISKRSNILIIHHNNSRLQISKTQNILIILLGGGAHILEHWVQWHWQCQ